MLPLLVQLGISVFKCLNVNVPNIKMCFTLLLQLNMSSLAVIVFESSITIKNNFMK